MTDKHPAEETRVREALGAAFAENAGPADPDLDRIADDARRRAAEHASSGAGHAHPRLRTPVLIAAVIVAVALGGVIVAQLAAPWNSRILEGAAASAASWRQPGMITHFVQETQSWDSETGTRLAKERREVWANYDATQRRETRTGEGTVSVEGSIFDVTGSMSPVSGETSWTRIGNDRYTADLAETAEGVAITVDHSQKARKTVQAHLWNDPCSLCHREGVSAAAEAARLGQKPAYVAAIEAGEFKVVGRSVVGTTPTYLLRAELPIDTHVTEVTLVDIDRDTYTPLLYRIVQVTTLEEGKPLPPTRARTVSRNVMTTRILSHDLIAPKGLPPDWFELTPPAGKPWIARETFAATETVSWPPPPPASAPASQPTTPPVYDLGESLRIDGVLITGMHVVPTPAEGGHTSVAGKAETGTPPATLEVMQPAPSPAATPRWSSMRTVAEYVGVTPANEEPKWAPENSFAYDSETYTPLIWVVTLPPGFSVWGAVGDDFVVVEKPDATIAVRPARGSGIPKAVLEEAATHLRRRQ